MLILIFTFKHTKVLGWSYLANVHQHISQAQHNESFLSFIGDNSDYLDWKFISKLIKHIYLLC